MKGHVREYEGNKIESPAYTMINEGEQVTKEIHL
jgi:hypothetical protein